MAEFFFFFFYQSSFELSLPFLFSVEVGVNDGKYSWFSRSNDMIYFSCISIFLLWLFQIPGQRGLGLKLLHSVLDKAILNIHRNQVRHTVRYDNKVDKSTDWEAVWAYTLGPEPELVLSLR